MVLETEKVSGRLCKF